MLFYVLAPVLVAAGFVLLAAADVALWRWRDKRAAKEAREWVEREGANN